jgi:hypothetical protein
LSLIHVGAYRKLFRSSLPLNTAQKLWKESRPGNVALSITVRLSSRVNGTRLTIRGRLSRRPRENPGCRNSDVTESAIYSLIRTKTRRPPHPHAFCFSSSSLSLPPTASSKAQHRDDIYTMEGNRGCHFSRRSSLFHCRSTQLSTNRTGLINGHPSARDADAGLARHRRPTARKLGSGSHHRATRREWCRD